ncbi:MAG: sigma-70 family RNA polymerase sigma factor [Dysosmobacter sp.]|nr:sigma-70 family RNA polymerase sigma factor [Dysosmobacter sp.]
MTEHRFQEAVELYGDMVFRLAYSYLKNRADAEDIMQESLLKLYVGVKDFESADHEKRWLIRVTVNECRKLLRAPWRRRSSSLDEVEETAVFDQPSQTELFQQVMGLPPKYRGAVYLHYYEGYSVKEIAGLLGAKTSTVQTWLMRARGQLKIRLKEAEAL